MDLILDKKKREIIEFVTDSKNEEKLNEILQVVREPEIEYETFDFEKEWAKGISVEQAKVNTKKRIQSWWGK